MNSLRIAGTLPQSTVNGPGRRAVVHLQGCTLACPGCCNPELFAADGGAWWELAALRGWLCEARALHGVEGLSVLGGEPTEQLAGVTALCSMAREIGLGVIVFSGRTLAELAGLAGGATLLATVDTLVDGRFEAGRREPADGRRFIGSRNQSLVHLSARYADPALWRGPGGVELQLGPDGGVAVHGAPALARRLGRALARE